MTSPEDSLPTSAPAPTRRRAPRTRSSQLEFGSVISRTFSTWFRNFVPFTLLATVVYAPYIAYSFWVFEHADEVNPDLHGVIESVISGALGFFLSAAMIFAVMVS